MHAFTYIFSQPIKYTWPEFAANGKQDICMMNILDHTAGLHNMPNYIDDEKICEYIENMRPSFEHGTESCYSAILSGFIIKIFIEKKFNDTFDNIFDKFKSVHNITGLYFNRKNLLYHHIELNITNEMTSDICPNGIFDKIIESDNSIPSVSLYANSKSLFDFYHKIKIILSKETIEIMLLRVKKFYDKSFGCEVYRGTGFMHGNILYAGMKDADITTIGHTGIGGSVALIDLITGKICIVLISKLYHNYSDHPVYLYLRDK